MRYRIMGFDLSVRTPSPSRFVHNVSLSRAFSLLTQYLSIRPDPVDSAKSIYQRNSLMYSKGQKVEPVKIAFFQRNMYRGLGVSMGRSCAVNAVFFSSFEFLKKRIKAMDDRGHPHQRRELS